ncbi:unnamed protein product, partial [Mesorhabditis belari]|uniref:C-type lectin domain-containing protein n=1 Tax=Mesorhabditis belari TaxID=2138241 RepID=A0AAF3FAK5_9BILA
MFLMVIFLFTFLSQIDSACLPDFEAIPGESKCLFSSYGEHSGRPKAACSYKGTIPAKIENAFENSFVFSKLTDPDFSENIAYIGVEKQNGVWVYSDGSALTYTNWANGEPNSFEECAIMDRLSGKWKAENCGGAYPFFCTHGESK